MTEISLITSSTVDKDCIFLPSCCCLSPGANWPIMSDHHVAHGNVDVRLAIVERFLGVGDVFSALTSKSREFLQADVCSGKKTCS